MASLSRPMQADPGHKGRAAMPGGPRSLPRRPSLRYLKLEAKRRLAAGEFAALHDAQAAIAWEHGLPNWTALKQLICGQAQQQSHALAQVRWVIARFRDAGEPGWIAPDDDELRLHFDDQFLSEVPAAVLRLIADGRVGLDSPASECLRVVRLADDTITVRELLSHTAGVDSPAPAELFADTVPDLVTLAGPVIACSGTRGVVRPSNGGYAVLGQLIADVTGSPYRDAVTR